MKLTEHRISEILKKITTITGNPCEVSQGSKLFEFTYKGVKGYINIDMADYCLKEGRIQDYFDAIESLEPKP